MLEILDDDIPEPDEVFQVILAQPRDGVEIGDPFKGKFLIQLQLFEIRILAIQNFTDGKNFLQVALVISCKLHLLSLCLSAFFTSV